MHILFVDDTPDTVDLFRFCCNLSGHKVETASSGAEAIGIVVTKRNLLDVIIMDYHMDGMTGLQVAQHLQQMKGIASIPIIMSTIDDRDGLEDKIEEVGIKCLVYKPVLPQQLLDIAQQVIDRI